MSNKTVEKSVGKLPFIIIAVLAVGFIGYTLLPSADDISSTDASSVELPQPEIISNSPRPEKVDVTQEVSIDEPIVSEIIEEEIKEKVEAVPFDISTILNDGTELSVIAIGDPNAPITLVEYASLSCGHCAMFHNNTLPQLKEKYIDTGKVYMIFREFPLNKTAVDASKTIRCMPEDKAYSFMNLLFETQEDWSHSSDYLNKLKQNAKLAGISDEDFDKCLADKELEEKLAGSLKIGSDTYKVRSTPSFIVNGGEKMISGNQPLELFSKIFDGMLEEDNKQQ